MHFFETWRIDDVAPKFADRFESQEGSTALNLKRDRTGRYESISTTTSLFMALYVLELLEKFFLCIVVKFDGDQYIKRWRTFCKPRLGLGFYAYT